MAQRQPRRRRPKPPEAEERDAARETVEEEAGGGQGEAPVSPPSPSREELEWLRRKLKAKYH